MNNTLIVTAGHPRLALILTIISGVLNMVLDYFFIVVCDMGINGAALGTIISRIVGALLSVIFLISNKKGLTYKKPKWEGRMLLRVTGNGSSEMISNLSSSVTTFLFNLTVLRRRCRHNHHIIYAVFLYSGVPRIFNRNRACNKL